MSEISDSEWLELVKAGEDAGWKLVWERVIVSETRSMRSADMMRRYSITDGDLMGMLYDEMLGRKQASHAFSSPGGLLLLLLLSSFSHVRLCATP